jgi:purine-nucleoside phosphorylase
MPNPLMSPDPARAAAWIREQSGMAPEILIVLGSGLELPSGAFEGGIEIPFESLPGFPPAGVVGHPGRYLAGRLEGRTVLLQRGRYHYYEGHSSEVVAALIITNNIHSKQ